MKKLLCLKLLLFCASMLLPRAAVAQDWLLANANELDSEPHIILTVPNATPVELTELAEELANEFGVTLAAEWPLNAISVHCLVFGTAGIDDVEQLLENMRADARVRTAQAIETFEVTGTPSQDVDVASIQWALGAMNVPSVHGFADGSGVLVGIADTAIDKNHPDLAANVIDARDFVSVSPTFQPEEHGTAVAGLIAASNTEGGLLGVAPNAEILGLRACWQERASKGRCNSFSLARAINFAILNDVHILNLSIGGQEDALLTELIEAALDNSIVVVSASGEGDAKVFPARLPGVISSGMIGSKSIPAPMNDIISTAPNESHNYFSGSSIATAHVTGIAALMLSMNPDLSPSQIAERLRAAVSLDGNFPIVDACLAALPMESCP